ncbi:MAG TPA: MEDS domain-containing protein [Bacteroidia bacterium]|jgi:hypothetical protein
MPKAQKSVKEEMWAQSDTKVFWGEIAPSDHLVQIYENESVILDSLEGFVSSGFEANDSVIIIAAAERINTLNKRLIAGGYDLADLIAGKSYFPIDAHEALAKFMRVGWPDEDLFMKMVESLLAEARGKSNRQVRAYGEMVAILWQQGFSGATVQLEHLWNKFCEKESFCLFCAYPKSGFTQDPETSIKHICSTHTKMLHGFSSSKTEVFYKAV